jgi:Predicted membrane-bound mannosyltransferase
MPKSTRSDSSSTKNEEQPTAVEPVETQTRDWTWLIGCAAITALAAAFRFIALDLKPFHHDEGVNGFFLTTLFRDGVYKYDPANYHGPTLYYIALLFAKVFGLETEPVRASVAIWGVLMVVLCFYLCPYIGKTASLFAGLFVAVSPGMVFILAILFTRYFLSF